MKKDFLEFVIKGIALDSQNGLPIIILKSPDGFGILPLRAGPFEASAIIIEIENVHPPRPLTHDLLSEFFTRHRYRLDKLVIYEKIEDDYLARIEYTKNMKRYRMEVRPSDGIALALRMESPILVARSIVDTLDAGTAMFENMKEYTSEILYLEPDNTSIHLM